MGYRGKAKAPREEERPGLLAAQPKCWTLMGEIVVLMARRFLVVGKLSIISVPSPWPQVQRRDPQ